MTQSTTRSLRRALLCLIAASTPLTLLAATISVPSTATPTIQAGIDAASSGDTVLVAPGTYYENIDFKGKAITVTAGGLGATASTIIDGGSKGPAVTFKSGETRASVLSYFSIQNGGNFETYTGSSGSFAAGGIVIAGSAPTLLGNLILHNNCWSIYSTQSAPLIQGNTISATQDPRGNCSFGGGAAIYISGNFNGPNQASISGAPPMIIGNIIQDNVQSGLEDAGGNGGAGIAVWGGSPIIAKNIIRNNASPGGSGGAINVESGEEISITQNLIYGNSAGCGGGALAFDAGSSNPSGFGVLIANNTIVDNTYDQTGGGYSECTNIAQIYPNPDQYGNGNPREVLVNNIIAGDTSERAIDGDFAFSGVSEANQPIFDHNLFYNAGGLVFGMAYVDVSSKYGNIVADPQFVDRKNHDYHLRLNSPGIDTGNTSVLQSLETITGDAITTDFDGNPRLQDNTGKGYPIIDMGAYEYAGQRNASDTTVVLTSSSYAGDAGSNYVLTANLASALGVPTGSVTFYLDGKQIGVSKIGGDGQASLTNFLVSPGVHSLYAAYAGVGSFTPATSVIIILQAYLYGSKVVLDTTPNPSLLNQPVVFTVTVSSSDTSFIPSPISLYLNGNATAFATLLPDAAGRATYTTSSLALGYNSVSADYAGDSAHSSAADTVQQQVINVYATTTTLTSSANPSNTGQAVTFTATVTSPSGTPTGRITFTDGSTILDTKELVDGVATYTTSLLAAGTHSITATYNPGTASFSISNASLSQVVNGITTSTSLDVTPTTGVYGTNIRMTSTVNLGGTPNQSGGISFMDGTVAIAVGELVNNETSSTYNDMYLSVGTHDITAVYSGDALHNASTSKAVMVTITAAPTALTLNAAPNPALALRPIVLTAKMTAADPASRSINFLANGVLLGSAPTDDQGNATLTTALPTGTYSLVASFAGSANLAPSTSAPVAEIVNPNPTAAAVSAQPNPGYQGGNETLTASVSTVGTSTSALPVPSGAVTFLDSGTLIATANLDALGHASFSTTGLAVGTHSLTAVYTGTANFLPSISPAYSLTILPRDFSLTTDPAITIQTQHYKNLSLTLGSIGDFTDTVALSCAALPIYATCTFPSNGMMLPAGATASISIHIDTDALLNYLSSKAPANGPESRPGSGIAYGLLLPAAFAVLRRRRKLPRIIGLCLGLAVSLMAMTLTGCSGHYPGHTPPGTYTFTVTGQGAATRVTHTATVTLIVTE